MMDVTVTRLLKFLQPFLAAVAIASSVANTSSNWIQKFNPMLEAHPHHRLALGVDENVSRAGDATVSVGQRQVPHMAELANERNGA